MLAGMKQSRVVLVEKLPRNGTQKIFQTRTGSTIRHS